MKLTKVVQFKQQSSIMPEIPTEVVQPIEEKVAMEEVEIPAEVVVAIEPEEQAMAKILAEVIQPIQDISAEVQISSEVVQPIAEKVAIEEVEIPAEVVQPIEEKVAIAELETPAEVVVAIEPEEKAIVEIPAKVVQPIGEKVAVEEVELPAEVVVAIEPDEQAIVEIPLKVVRPIEKKVAIEQAEIPVEVLVVIEPEEQAMEEYKHLKMIVAIPAEGIEPIEGEMAIEKVVVVIESEEQARKEVKCVDVEDREVVVMEGVTKGEGVSVVNSVGAGPEIIAMEEVYRVKYNELVPEEEHITITEIQLKDTAYNIDASNSCTHDCMMGLTGYDPEGTADINNGTDIAVRSGHDYGGEKEGSKENGDDAILHIPYLLDIGVDNRSEKVDVDSVRVDSRGQFVHSETGGTHESDGNVKDSNIKVSKLVCAVGVTSMEGGLRVRVMTDINGVKYDDLQEEEDIATAETQIKDSAHDIDTWISCTHDCMMDLTSYDPGGGITDIVTANDGVNMSVLGVTIVDAQHSEINIDKGKKAAVVDKDKQEEAWRFKRDYV